MWALSHTTGRLKVLLLCVVKCLCTTLFHLLFPNLTITTKRFNFQDSAAHQVTVPHPILFQNRIGSFKITAHLLFGFPQFFKFIIFYLASSLISYASLYLPFTHKLPHLTEGDAMPRPKQTHSKSFSHLVTGHRKTEKLPTFVSL